MAAAFREQNLAYRGCGDAVAGSLQLADNALVSPVRVLSSEPEDHHAESRFEWWTAQRPVRVGPAAGNQFAMPTQQRLTLHREHRAFAFGAWTGADHPDALSPALRQPTTPLP